MRIIVALQWGETCGLTTGQMRFDNWSNRFSDLTTGQTDIPVGQVFEPILRFDNWSSRPNLRLEACKGSEADGTFLEKRKKQDRAAGFLLFRSEDLFVAAIPRAPNIGRAEIAGNVEINAAGTSTSQESNV